MSASGTSSLFERRRPHRLTPDEHYLIRALFYEQNWSIRKISRELGFSRDQVSRAIHTIHPPNHNTHRTRHGPAPQMSPADQQRLVDYVNAHPRARRDEMRALFDDRYGPWAIYRTLRRLRFYRVCGRLFQDVSAPGETVPRFEDR